MLLNSTSNHTESNTPLISIIIPTYNRKDELANCITSMADQSYKNFEIIIIDDCSADGTVDFLNDNFPEIKILKNKNRSGPTLARNIGIKKSKGSLILFIDSDIEFHSSHTLQNMVYVMQTYPDIGSIGGEIPASNNTGHAYGRLFKKDGKISVAVSNKYLNGDKDFKICDYLATCNCMVRRDTALKTGGFDPFYIFGAEDMDFGYAIRKSGYKNVVGYNYAVIHHRSKIGRFKEESIMYHRTGVRFIIKRYGLLSYFIRVLNDTGYIILFYLTLIPKIIIYMLKGKKMAGNHFFYGIKMIYSHLWNLMHLKETISCRKKDFLETKEMSNIVNEIQRRVSS